MLTGHTNIDIKNINILLQQCNIVCLLIYKMLSCQYFHYISFIFMPKLTVLFVLILGMLPDSNTRYIPQGYAPVNKVSSINDEESSLFYDSNTRNGTRRKPLHRLCKFIQQT